MTLPSDRLPTDLRALAQQVNDLKRDLKELRAGRRLEHATVAGSIRFLDASGNVAAKLGQQTDGTVALAVTAGPTPPAPTNPVVTAELAALGVSWDGEFVGGVGAPADWLRVEVHVSDVSGFTPSQATLRQTIETTQGATVLVPLPYVAQYVRLRSCTTSGAVSAPTAEVSETPRQAAADDISADAITGKVITGGTIQTSDTDPALVITDDGYLRVYDSASNTVYEAGGPNGLVKSYSVTGVTALLKVLNGILYFGEDDGTNFAAQIYGELGGNAIQLLGGRPDDGAHGETRLRLLHGASSGSSGRPTAAIDSPASTDGRADLTVTGNLTAGGVTLAGGALSYLVSGTTVETSHLVGSAGNAAFATNWTTSTFFGGSSNWPGLQYWRDGQGNVVINGVWRASTTTAPGLTVFQLPVGYRPAVQRPVKITRRNGSTVFTGLGQVSGSGNLNLLTDGGLAVATGDYYAIDAIVPLGS
jgi:hypothetical protein